MKKFIFLLFSFLQIFCLASIVNAQSGPVPSFSPSEGYVQSPQVVTITASGATIYYTTNGSIPTTALPGYASSVQVYVTTRTTIRAMAVKSGISGPLLTKEYIPVIAPAAPTNAEMKLTQDCAWTASWASGGSGPMYYYVLDSLGVNTYVSAPNLSLNVACPTGNPNGKKPVSVRACTYNSCSAPTTFVAVKSEFHSLIVNDKVTLAAADFSLQSVFTQLADQLSFANPTDPVTANSLFARMWDTQNVAPGTPTVLGPKCTGKLNAFQHVCRPSEGIQAANPSTWINNYQPIALVNRFDLRDKVTFLDCGEARMVFGLKSAVQTSNNRNFIIFEAQLPNPTPGSAAGCLPIANFWNRLSDMSDVVKRAAELRNFYFNGIPAQSIGPVIHKDNYAPATGQIRTNQFMSNSGSPWVLKEFKVTIENGFSFVKPVSVKSNPFGELFRGNSDTKTLAFQNDFIANMDTLLTDRDSFFLKVVNDSHNNGESHASGIDTAENNFTTHFNFSQGTGSFRTAVTNKLQASGATITAGQVINRATAMTCGGCHQPSAFGLTATTTSVNSIAPGVSWPDSLGFVHIGEKLNSATQIEFDLSPALKTVFLPARKRDFLQYLNSFGVSVNAASFQKTAAPVVKSTITGKRSG